MARKRSRSRASRRKRKQPSVTDEALPIFGVIFGVAIVLGHLDANSLMLVLLAAASLCVFRLWLLRKRREAAQFRARTLDELLALSPRQFEFAIADLDEQRAKLERGELELHSNDEARRIVGLEPESQE